LDFDQPNIIKNSFRLVQYLLLRVNCKLHSYSSLKSSTWVAKA